MAFVGSCRTPEEYRASADEEVYGILLERRAELGTDDLPFTIDPPPDSLRQRLLRGEPLDRSLHLVDCLEIAAENNRQFQTQRESLYLEALDLTLERFRFSNQYSLTGGGDLFGTGEDSTNASVDASLGLSRLLGNGTRVIMGIGGQLFRNLASGDGWDAISDLSLSITKPLLAGSNRRIVMEPLTQAERDVVYSVMSFERFRSTFAVDVATRLYRLLQQAQVVINEEANVANLVLLRERNEAFAEAGRLSDIEVDQARQNELSSKNRVIEERQRFQAAVDSFALFLGLPIGTELNLDPSELERLAADDLARFDWEWEGLRDYALLHRLDYRTREAQVEDARRRVNVAADALRARLGLVASAGVASPEGQPVNVDPDDIDWQLGFDFDLPVQRIPERNVYRRSLVSLQALERSRVEFADQIAIDLRDDLRETTRTLETYRIQLNSVTLADRRVESTSLNLDAGRATTRDLLEAQEALVEAQNAAVRALIDYHLARFILYLDLELLTVGEEGINLDDQSLVQWLGGA